MKLENKVKLLIFKTNLYNTINHKTSKNYIYKKCYYQIQELLIEETKREDFDKQIVLEIYNTMNDILSVALSLRFCKSKGRRKYAAKTKCKK